MAAAVVVMVVAASVEEGFTAAASVGAVFEADLPALVFAAAFVVVAFAAALTVMAFAEVAFAAAAFMMVASTMGSSLVILVTRSFTIPIHTTGTIPMAIILAIILMVTDTAALPAAVFVAAAFVAVGDPYNQSVYQGSAGYTDQLVGQIQLRLA